MSLRDEILGFDDTEYEEVTVKQWKNKKVLIRSITAGDRFDVVNKSMDKKDNIDITKLNMYTLIACVCDPETKKPLFTQADYEVLRGKNSGAIDTLLSTANRLNGLDEIAKKLAEKN